MTRQIIFGLIISVALIIFVPLAGIGFIVYSIYRDEVAEPIARQKVPEVKNEFRRIPLLAGATPTSNDGFTFDPRHLNEGRLYRSDLSYSEIKSHYDVQLSKLGWKLDRESQINGVDGKDQGGKYVVYSKGEFSARLHHKGTERDYGYDYHFCVSWDYK